MLFMLNFAISTIFFFHMKNRNGILHLHSKNGHYMLISKITVNNSEIKDQINVSVIPDQ